MAGTTNDGNGNMSSHSKFWLTNALQKAIRMPTTFSSRCANQNSKEIESTDRCLTASPKGLSEPCNEDKKVFTSTCDISPSNSSLVTENHKNEPVSCKNDGCPSDNRLDNETDNHGISSFLSRMKRNKNTRSKKPRKELSGKNSDSDFIIPTFHITKDETIRLNDDASVW